jgi:hypothetical protein
MLHVLPYKSTSESAKLLAETLGVKRIKLENSRFKGSARKSVINWGNTNLPDQVKKCKTVFNPNVAWCSNKLKFFELIGGQEWVPDWTTDLDEAQEWSDEGARVFARLNLAGHDGDGIVDIDPYTIDIPPAPLYTKYIPKKEEYRVHFAFGKVILIQRKAAKRDVENINYRIRNNGNGFVFASNEDLGEVPKVVEAVTHSFMNGGYPIDFGAIDIIWNKQHGRAYILEVNTAPGLSLSTATLYAEAFKEYMDNA